MDTEPDPFDNAADNDFDVLNDATVVDACTVDEATGLISLSDDNPPNWKELYQSDEKWTKVHRSALLWADIF